MADKVQIDYEAMGQLSSRISSIADETQSVYSKVVSQVDVLASSWIGVGATSFQQEMEDLVLPGLKRLYEGLGQTTSAINTLTAHWQAAEEEATGLFPTE